MRYDVTIRGTYEQSVYVEADSPAEAKRIVREGAGDLDYGEPDFKEWWIARRKAEETEWQ